MKMFKYIVAGVLIWYVSSVAYDVIPDKFKLKLEK
jgi:hypothetical protein